MRRYNSVANMLVLVVSCVNCWLLRIKAVSHWIQLPSTSFTKDTHSINLLFFYYTMDVTIYNPFIHSVRSCGILISETKGGNQYGEIHSLREAFQEGKAQDGPGQTADLGRAEPRHPEARKQQGIQPKQSPELEA